MATEVDRLKQSIKEIHEIEQEWEMFADYLGQKLLQAHVLLLKSHKVLINSPYPDNMWTAKEIENWMSEVNEYLGG